MKVNSLGTVPDKSAASDYYSEGVIIVDAANPYKCPVLWLNTICKDIIGECSCSYQLPWMIHHSISLSWMPHSASSCHAGLTRTAIHSCRDTTHAVN